MAAPAQIKFTHAVTQPNNDTAILNITDLNGNGPVPGDYLLDGPLSVTANDGGGVVALTVTESQIIANANGVGTATVTVTGTEAGVVVTGTMTVTVTFTNGQLHTAWSSGTGGSGITVN